MHLLDSNNMFKIKHEIKNLFSNCVIKDLKLSLFSYRKGTSLN